MKVHFFNPEESTPYPEIKKNKKVLNDYLILPNYLVFHFIVHFTRLQERLLSSGAQAVNLSQMIFRVT